MKLFKFYAPWCQPCKMLDKMLSDYDNDLVTNRININIDEDPDTAMKFKVRGVPTIIVVDSNGQEVKRLVGIVTQQKLTEFVT